MKWDELSDDWCPIARASSIVGDRWTLLIVRDCFLGVSRFDQFQKNLGITRHVLAQRLKRLVAVGVLEKKPYQTRPERYDYVLTERGKELGPVLETLRHWGREYLSIRRQAGIGETIDE
ncbi:winged helix-turn-helix transcriptional regulator [Hirschia maritima]|uniref:winged helix-turn-helix transcriptional regulator n=1 Tax=Hirschia maritima TaxID=1121961 RepID=UPI00035E276D|nr:helix-turn-helix domain-containing protein [Hirschia maritima]